MSNGKVNDVNDFTWLKKNLKTTDTAADKLKKIRKFTAGYKSIPQK